MWAKLKQTGASIRLQEQVSFQPMFEAPKVNALEREFTGKWFIKIHHGPEREVIDLDDEVSVAKEVCFLQAANLLIERHYQ